MRAFSASYLLVLALIQFPILYPCEMTMSEQRMAGVPGDELCRPWMAWRPTEMSPPAVLTGLLLLGWSGWRWHLLQQARYAVSRAWTRSPPIGFMAKPKERRRLAFARKVAKWTG